MKTKIVLLMAILLSGCSTTANEPITENVTPTKNNNVSMKNAPPSKSKATRMRDEIFSKFIYSGKKIRNNVTANIYTASYYWARQSADDKTRLKNSFHKELIAYKPQNLNKCQSLINVYEKQIALFQKSKSLDMLSLLNSQSAIKNYKPLKFTGVEKYKVTPQQFNKILQWEYAWNEPAICGCELGNDITTFCVKNGYKPLPMPK